MHGILKRQGINFSTCIFSLWQGLLFLDSHQLNRFENKKIKNDPVLTSILF